MDAQDQLLGLPDTFRFTEALQHMNERKFRALLASMAIVKISRGLYRKADVIGDEDLMQIAARSPHATLALRSALARHGLIDDIPAEIDIAIPRGAWTPIITTPVRWHHFAAETFDIGRQSMDLGNGQQIGIFSAQRSIIDAFRLRQFEGEDMATAALKQWLRQGGQPSELLGMTRAFPAARRAIQSTMSILL
ncbi:hypothetical protein PP299_04570 [Mycobacteroides abscessus]|nr:hypothetical protein [Mycobacteroides abscessus]MDM1905926.1 hypothetical protein [Mycobacteroides abscessus]MDM1910675.1 hypothetical protein [Mycobacteroides abscessus]MDM1919337.1 hypothetical protein [Mycobacteroides abscessus]